MMLPSTRLLKAKGSGRRTEGKKEAYLIVVARAKVKKVSLEKSRSRPQAVTSLASFPGMAILAS